MIVTLQEVFKVFLGRFQKCDLTEPDRRGWAAARRPPDGIATVAVSELSSGHPVVIGMCANPEPEDAIFDLNSQRPVVKPTRTDQRTSIFLKCKDGWWGSAFSRAKARSASVRMSAGRDRYELQKSGAAWWVTAARSGPLRDREAPVQRRNGASHFLSRPRSGRPKPWRRSLRTNRGMPSVLPS